MNLKDQKLCIYLTLCITLIIYLPLILLATNNISYAIAFNGDLCLYLENILKFQYGITYHDLQYALSQASYGYGNFFFLFLCILCFPFMMMGNETFVLIILRGFSLLCFLGCEYIIIKIYLLATENDEKIIPKHIYISCIILSFLPASALLLTHIHPEIFQMLLFNISLLLMIKYIKYEKTRYLVFSALFSGLMVGCKISGVIFILPFIILLLSNSHKFFSILYYGFLGGATALLSTVPSIIISPKKTITDFVTELKFFANTLQTYSISEFDYYEKLETKTDVLLSWLSHAFSHGYISIFIILLLLALCIKEAYREIKYRKQIKLNLSISLMFIINFAYYTLSVTRVSTYYLYLPTIMLIFTYFLNYKHNHITKEKIATNIVILIALIPSFYHFLNIYSEQLKLSMRLNSNNYENFTDFLSHDNNLKKDSILIPTSINLNMSLNQLRWIPNWRDINSNEPILRKGDSILNHLEYYWTLEDYLASHSNFDNIDILVIDKSNERNYSIYTDIIMQGGKAAIFEDSFIIAYGTKLSADPLLGNICNIPFYKNSKLGWERIDNNLIKNPINLDNAERLILSFDYNSEHIEKLRIVCKSSDNIWDFELNNINIGHNVIEISKKQFDIQQGIISWCYIDTIEIGAEFTDYIQLSNLTMEVK